MPRATPNLVPSPQQVVPRFFSVGRELRRGQGWKLISGLAEALDPGADNKQASGSLETRVQQPGPARGRALGDGVVEGWRPREVCGSLRCVQKVCRWAYT